MPLVPQHVQAASLKPAVEMYGLFQTYEVVLDAKRLVLTIFDAR